MRNGTAPKAPPPQAKAEPVRVVTDTTGNFQRALLEIDEEGDKLDDLTQKLQRDQSRITQKLKVQR